MIAKIESALFYKNTLGFSIIPIRADNKLPHIKWKEYQYKLANDGDVRIWWGRWPEANIGVVTGKISNIAVVDIDTEEGFEKIKKYIPDTLEAPRVTTPSGGMHIYFRYPKQGISNNSRAIKGCDLRGNGGYVLAPPSTNYTWLDKKALHNFPDLPMSYIEEVKKADIVAGQFKREMFKEGTRDADLFHVANCLARGAMNRNNIEQVIEILAVNCSPPFPLDEAKNKVVSALNRINTKGGK